MTESASSAPPENGPGPKSPQLSPRDQRDQRDRRDLPEIVLTGIAILKTLSTVLVTMLGLLFVTFIISRLSGIDPVLALVGESASKETYDQVYRELGLHKPILVQFWHYLSGVVQGDFGNSTLTARPVLDDIKRVFPATLELATLGTLIGVFFGVPLGVVAAVNKGRWIDQIARVIALVGYSMPIFILGFIAIVFFYAHLGWVSYGARVDVWNEGIVPSVTGMLTLDAIIDGNWDIFKNAFSYIALPASLLGYYSLAYISRMTRSFMLEQMSSEYVTTARVKGLSEWAVIWRHAFGNIRVQLITVIALSYANLLEGSVLTEIIFAWPGIGNYLTTALLSADLNAVMGGTIVVGFIFVCLNIFSDLLYKYFDPRAK